MTPCSADGRIARLYVVSTPYHILLAVADAARRAVPCGLFVFGNFPTAAQWIDALQYPTPLLAGLAVSAVTLDYGDRAATRSARGVLRAALDAQDPHTVVVFNDHHDLSQYALGWAAQRGRSRLAIEDGSSFYSDWRVARHDRRLRQWRKRLTTAYRWTALTVPGTHPLLQRVLVRRPDLVRPELRGRVEALDVAPTRDAAAGELARRVWAQLGRGAFPPRPTLLLAPGIGSTLGWPAIARRHAQRADGVAYKYHPRETRPDPYGLAAVGRELPRGIALELLHALWGGSADEVVSDAGSTVLLSSRLESSRASLTGYYRGARPAHADAYARAGIALVEDAA